MPTNVRDHLYAGLLVATAALLVVGIVVLWNATAFEGYISALLLWSVAITVLLAARELKGRSAEADLRALINHLRRRKPDEKQTSVGN
jgi:uncharacterized membrane protein